MIVMASGKHGSTACLQASIRLLLFPALTTLGQLTKAAAVASCVIFKRLRGDDNAARCKADGW